MKSIIITEKSSQAKDVEAAVGDQYGKVYAAQGHLLVLEEPGEANPDWMMWGFDLLRPEKGFYDTKAPASAAPSAKAKLKAISRALKGADTVIIATDCDREGEGIGRELLDHFGYKGKMKRALFTATDKKSIREAFERLEPAETYENAYQAFRARQQGDQIFNLTMTRVASQTIRPPSMKVLGIGRVKTPTLGLICRREDEVKKFVPQNYFTFTAVAEVLGAKVMLAHDPEKYGAKEKLLSREEAQKIADAVSGHKGSVVKEKAVKKRKPPRLMDLPQLQKTCGSRWAWSATKTLEVAQALYDTHKILTYPRAETRYLSENQIADIGDLLAGLADIPGYLVPGEPVIRKGKKGTFCDSCLAGVSHHAVIPNAAMAPAFAEKMGRLSTDEKQLFDLVARHYIAAVSGDWVYDQTTLSVDARGYMFSVSGKFTRQPGWKAAFGAEPGASKDESPDLPDLYPGDGATLTKVQIVDRVTAPPPRYNEGSLIGAMQNVWKTVADDALAERLKDAKGIGTPATRAVIIHGLLRQNQITQPDNHLVPTEEGLEVYRILLSAAPALLDAARTAEWEMMLDEISTGTATVEQAVARICEDATELIDVLRKKGDSLDWHGPSPPSAKMVSFAQDIAAANGIALPKDCITDYLACKRFLDDHAGSALPPSKKQVALVESLMAKDHPEPESGWRDNAEAVRKYLDKVFKQKKAH